MEPGRPPKTDKVAILSDAVRAVVQLRNEAERLKEMNDELQGKVKELKVIFFSRDYFILMNSIGKLSVSKYVVIMR